MCPHCGCEDYELIEDGVWRYKKCDYCKCTYGRVDSSITYSSYEDYENDNWI